MAKADDLLKDMIRFHGKRIAKEMLGELPRQMKQAHRDIRALEKTLTVLTKRVDALLDKARTEAPIPPAPEEEVEKARFTKRTLPAIRKKFGLTQQDLARLLEVGALTVSSWERGRSRPRAASLATVIALRGMTQQQVDQALGREAAPAAMDPQAIKDMRDRLGVSQTGLAKLVGVSSAAVGSWESGRSVPGAGNREALAQVKGMAPEEVDERLGRTAGGSAVGRVILSPAEIRAIRQAAELSQKELAKVLGVNSNSVSNWETGATKPRGSSVEKLLAMRK